MTDKLAQAAEAAGEDLAWSAIRSHLYEAVNSQLPLFGGHDKHGPVPTDREAWRRADPEELAEKIVTHAMAGIGPVLFRLQVDNGLRLMRAVLAKAGIDPETLEWQS